MCGDCKFIKKQTSASLADKKIIIISFSNNIISQARVSKIIFHGIGIYKTAPHIWTSCPLHMSNKHFGDYAVCNVWSKLIGQCDKRHFFELHLQ